MAIIKQYRADRDVTYCYESISYWDPELKQARSKRKLIGKLDPETGEIVPTSGKPGRKKGSKNKSPQKQTSNEESSRYKKLYEDQKKVSEKLTNEVKELKARLKSAEKEKVQLLRAMEKAAGLLLVDRSAE